MPYKYYGVRKGRNPGVYDNWPDAQDQTDGYPGARFKGFDTHEEAEAFAYGGVPDRVEVRRAGHVRQFPLDAHVVAALRGAGLDL